MMSQIMPSETDVAPKAKCSLDGTEYWVLGRNTLGAMQRALSVLKKCDVQTGNVPSICFRCLDLCYICIFVCLFVFEFCCPGHQLQCSG